MITELWRRVPGYKAYEVSNEGRIRRVKDKRVLKPRLDGGGYVQTALYEKKARKSFQVHRLVLSVFVSPPFQGAQGNHIDGNKSNNAWWNLEWCTGSQNATHARQVLGRGARVPMAIKLQICAFKAAGKTRREIAVDMGILQRTVHGVVAGRQWAGVK
jgi:hypothetical protein